MPQAYCVQRLNLDRTVGAGRRLREHKIGLTSAPMQQLLGVIGLLLCHWYGTAVLTSE